MAAPERGRVVWLVCAEDPGLNHDTVRVYQSRDDARSWSITSESTTGFDNLPATFATSCCVWDLATLDGSSAWIAAGNDAVMQTSDSGRGWEGTLHSDYGDGTRVLFIDPNAGFSLAENTIWSTEDGGAHWARRFSPGAPH
jgi:photosystem II stability/assembly factor-like uncharacterized protein